jgi:putative transport protein
VAAELGDSPRELTTPDLLPVLLGIAAGVVLGMLPLALPGVPAPVRLGLAGGPLLVALALSRIGHLGPLVWYLPPSANLALRELGIVLFLAAVGIRAGDRFVATLVAGDGLAWMGLAALITLVPLLAAALVGRLAMRLNFLSLCGLLAGSMTDPPALAFASRLATSDAPAVSYATVYPLTMILRVVCAQLLVLVFV